MSAPEPAPPLASVDDELRDDGARWGWYIAAVWLFAASAWFTRSADWGPAGVAFYGALLAGTHPHYQRRCYVAGYGDGWRDRGRRTGRARA